MIITLFFSLVLSLITYIPLFFLNAYTFEMCWFMLASPLGWKLPFSIKELVVIMFFARMTFIFTGIKPTVSTSDNEPLTYSKIFKDLSKEALKDIMICICFVFLSYLLSLILQ